MAKAGLYHYSTGVQHHSYVCLGSAQRGFPLLPSKFYVRWGRRLLKLWLYARKKKLKTMYEKDHAVADPVDVSN